MLNKSVLFHTHYMEITEWYGRMDVKNSEYERVSGSIQEGERRKEEWMNESDATAQALEHQAQMMNIDNRETVAVIQRLINDIGTFLVLIVVTG
ncbi:unnamed protein product [Gongylonema pulchrum]|uniref:Uncharacterized protein n=1 Tax=Gongylonema pulchrum TaxID=637853 RepID=A0A3P6RUZ3_9BILA|nr:unnamed protein product [Gongylonema pulchrum]